MELKNAIYTRRSVRNYTSEIVNKETISELINAGIQAPSGMNAQPWAFSVIQDTAQLRQISDEAKVYLLGLMETRPQLERYRGMFSNPDYNIFYNASTLLIVYAKPGATIGQIDCSLAAYNIMLTAHSMGLGTCWIGFAQMFLNLPGVKEKFDIPSDYTIIAPLIVGYPVGSSNKTERQEPLILFWK